MSNSTTLNRRIILNSRPVGAPTTDNFHLEEIALAPPAAGQVLLRTLYLSLDPYMRGRMSDGPSYAAPVALGEVMVGGTVSCVEASQHQDFTPGDLVLGKNGWQSHVLSDGKGLNKLMRQWRDHHSLWAYLECPVSLPIWVYSILASRRPATPSLWLPPVARLGR